MCSTNLSRNLNRFFFVLQLQQRNSRLLATIPKIYLYPRLRQKRIRACQVKGLESSIAAGFS